MTNSVRYISILLGLVATALIGGCRKDNDPVMPEEDCVELSLTLTIADGSASRAYDDPLDYDTRLQRYIAEGDIYVIFYNEYDAMVMVPDLNELEGLQGSNVRRLKGRIPRQESDLKFRVIANVAQTGILGRTSEEVKRRLQEFAAAGMTDRELCSRLTFKGTNAAGKWMLTEAGNYLPMQSAMSAPVSLRQNVNASVPMYRSLAKIGVEYISPDNNFELKKVRVYNQNDIGALISLQRPSSNIMVQFTTPYIPRDAVSRSGYVEYDVTDNSLLEQIFVPEFHNTGSSTADMHILVGGYFNGSTDMSWYDMRFTEDGHEGTAPYDVVRNHSYIFRITKVTGTDLIMVLKIELEPSFEGVHVIPIH